jgi:hypothetical protein
MLPAGRKESFSLVERAYMAYAKNLLKGNPMDTEAISAFVPKLESLAEQHPEMDYPGYFAGKLMLALKEKGDDIVATIRPFVRKKKNEFWAWQLLAEAVEESDKDLYLASLLRAVQCKTKADYLVNIRLRLVKEFFARQAFYHAVQQLRKYGKTKLAYNANWQPSGEVRYYFDQLWQQRDSYQQEPLPIDYLTLTNHVLFGDIPEIKCLVSFVNSDKQIVTVVYGKEKEGFFKYDSSLQPTIGMILSIRVQEVSQDGFMKVFSARESFDGFNSDCEYYKEIEGIVIYNEHKKIYSFKAGNIVCFIPSQYVENYSLERGQNIKSMILYSYNKKQDKWMWKLIGIVS